METETTYSIPLLKKIRRGFTQVFKHQGLRIGKDYKLSKVGNLPLPIFKLTIVGHGLTFPDFKQILQTKYDKISFNENIFEKELKINVENIYNEKIKDFKTRKKPESTFKNKLIEFIKERTKLNPGVDFSSGDFCVEFYPIYSEGESYTIKCLRIEPFFRIVKSLENDEYYLERIDIVGPNEILVKERKNYTGGEKIKIVKGFFEKFKKIYQKNNILFKIKTPATVIADKMKFFSEIWIVLKFSSPIDAENFIKSKPKNWNYDFPDMGTIKLFLEANQILESKEVKDFISLVEINNLNNKNLKKDGNLGKYLNPIDLSFLNEDLKIEKINSNLKNTKMKITELTEKRKEFVKNLSKDLSNKLPVEANIKIETKKFTSTADAFELSFSEEFKDLIQDQLKKKGLYYTNNDGYVVVIYPEELFKQNGSENLQSKNKELKTLIRFCSKEREGVLKVLGSKNFFYKKGGRGKRRPGSFSVSRSDGIASSMTLSLDILNKKNYGTLNQIFKVVYDYYNNHNKRRLVKVEKNEKDFIVNVFYNPDFFKTINSEKKLKDTEVISDKNITNKSESEIETEENELSLIIDMATEEDKKIEEQIKNLEDKKKSNHKEFLVSASTLFVKTFWETLESKGIKLFQVEHNGKLQLSELSADEIKESVSLNILEKLDLK